MERLDGVVMDLGLSSFQIDDPARGFSFRSDGPLDMRMDRAGPTAADLVATLDEADLADTLYDLGEERLSRRIARAIVQARAEAPIATTGQLAAIIRRVVPKDASGIDPATRSFQALRIRVNDELGQVERAWPRPHRCWHPVAGWSSSRSTPARTGWSSASWRRRPAASRPPPATTRAGWPAARRPVPPSSARALRPTDAEIARNPRVPQRPAARDRTPSGDPAMIRPMTCLSLLAALGAGLYLYQEKHSAQLLDRDINRT